MSAPAPAPPPRSLDSLRVALVHDWLTGMRGGEKCLEVLCEMFPGAPIYTLVHWRGSLSPAIESHPIHESWIARLPFGRSRYRWHIASYPKAIESFDLSGYDLVVSISHCAAKGVITRADTLHVCYCNTPVRYFWDLASEYFAPNRAGLIERLIGPSIAHRFRLWDRISADRVDLFAGNSFNIRDRIRKHYRRPALVVYPPVDTEFFTPAPGANTTPPAADAPFLTVSALVPYKGVDLTIRAANRLGAALRVIGSGPDLKRLRAIAGPTVRFEEWVSMEDLREAYRGCRALVQAHEEDFGIAPLEALACGRPAIALAKGGALETVTPDTGILFHEPTEAALAQAMQDLSRRRFDPAALRRQALLFSRDRYRSEMRSVLETAYRAHLLRHEDPEAVERPARRQIAGPLIAVAVLSLLLLTAMRPHESRSSTKVTSDFRNFETLQVHPLAITPDGSKLLALNTPDARLEVFAIGPGSLDTLGEVPVGLEPVSVRAQNDSTAWVVNQLSDDVSVVDLKTLRVRATLRVGDEPTDVVFAGSPLRAFVCVSGEDQVKAFDPATLASAMAPVSIFGRHPRALAAGAGGSQVYATVLEAGNKTTIVNAQTVTALGGPSPPNPPKGPSLSAAPAVGVIVQWNGAHWVDDGLPTPKLWDAGIPPGFSLPDVDVAVIDAGTGAVSTLSGIGTNNFNVAVDPSTGTLYVTNTDASNRTRFEPNLSGRFDRDQVTLIASGGAGAVTPVHLNGHINYAVSPGPQSERDLSLAEPIDIAVNSAAGKVYVAAMGSSRVGVLDLAGNVTNRIATSGAPSAPGVSPDEPRGPTGLALDAAGHQLFALNRFTNSIAILNTDTESKTGEVALRFDPSPPEVRNGRSFLYNANVSAHGDLACASCHIGGNLDNTSWDLGNPQGSMAPSLQLTGRQVHPMKGPMTTQSLRGLSDAAPFHWRADRLDFTRFNPAFVSLMGAPDSLSTADMQKYNDFIMTIVYPPNPNERLNRTLAALADSGRVEFTSRPHDGGQPCAFCHTFPIGTNRTIIPSILLQESQDFKVPQLRNMYQKTGFALATGPQKRGFGFLHDGSVDNLVNFLRAPVFQFPDTMARYEIQAFLLSFDTGLAPSVGRELTVNGVSKNSPGTTALLDSLYNEADLGNCDLIAHGRIGGVLKGFLYQAGRTFISDFNPEGTVLADTLRSWATNGGEITYLGVPPGSGMRMGIDRDRDGYRDRWELALGSNPADPLSTPAVTAVDGAAAPRVARLDQNRPNPFNPETVIPYDAGPGGRVSLRVFDASGRLVRTLVDAAEPPGVYRARWNGRNDRGRPVASGRYFYRLTVGKTAQTRAMTLVR